jgi:flagellar M-ring protein FliF
MVYDARMKLVSSGVPSGGHVGFELFNSTDFGVTEFAQRINYQRAIQGELERSIATLPGVDNVRVHLTIRKKGLFMTENDASKASVTVSMIPGEQLNSRQVSGIRNLVASAVDGLMPSAVIVLGPNGVMAGGELQSEDGSQSLMSEDQSGYEARVRYRINDLLSQALKIGTFKVTVDARINKHKVKTVTEIIPNQVDGKGHVIKRKISRTSVNGTNDFDQPVNAQEEFDYIYGKVLEEVSQAPGDIERLSVAVIVPDTISASEIEKIKKLVSASAGLDSSRGDRIEVNTISSVMSQVKNDKAQVDTLQNGVDQVKGKNWFSLNNLIMIILGFTLGILVMFFLRSNDKKLTNEERLAMREKLRSWLAEDGQSI